MNTLKNICITLSAALLLTCTTACNNKDRIVVDTDNPAQLNDLTDSLSWALGFTLANTIATTDLTPNREVLFEAICATLDGKQQPMTQQQTYHLLQELERQAILKTHAQNESMQQETQMREQVFFNSLLEENPNVKKSDKGFYYEVLQEGTGMQGAMGLVAVFDYKGSFTNGQVFDQTYGNRKPITHVIDDSMIPGLYEGLCMMKGGSTYRFYFPSDKAFGAKGAPEENIPPYTALIYEVEVHEIHE